MQRDSGSSTEKSKTGWNSKEAAAHPMDPTADPTSTLSGPPCVPVYTSPGRSGFGLQLTLSYDSGSGNGPFGLGWSLNLAAVTRKTGESLPRYEDDIESDVFLLSGVELTPLVAVTPSRSLFGRLYSIHRYRPPVEGVLERWVNLADPADTFWRSVSRDNVTTWYGKTPESRIADPEDPSRVFSWLICRSHDDKGNLIVYEYKPEDSENVNPAQANERNRTPAIRSVNRYIKRIFYGNRTPYLPDLAALPVDWCFELVFDFGEHDLRRPLPQETGIPWTCRRDPFSSYRSTFEVRTYRLCRRALMFHHFPDEEEVGRDCLVHSTDLTHAPFIPSVDLSRPFYSYLLSVKQTGEQPLEFKYNEAIVDETVREMDPPAGLDGSEWIDLNVEGVSGILTEPLGSCLYKLDWRNPELKFVDSSLLIREGGWFRCYKCAPQAQDEEKGPTLVFAGNAESIFLADLSGDGLKDVVRIREGEICYWPNRGHGRFGAKVVMDHAPWFDRSDLFDGRRIRLADIDGSGTADIVYFARNSVRLYFNQSGNGWSVAKVLRNVPHVDTRSTATAMDFLGKGTACLLWSASLSPDNEVQTMRYIDLMGVEKPHLLAPAPTAKFYVANESR
jgi:hypothetical protein